MRIYVWAYATVCVARCVRTHFTNRQLALYVAKRPWGFFKTSRSFGSTRCELPVLFNVHVRIGQSHIRWREPTRIYAWACTYIRIGPHIRMYKTIRIYVIAPVYPIRQSGMGKQTPGKLCTGWWNVTRYPLRMFEFRQTLILGHR